MTKKKYPEGCVIFITLEFISSILLFLFGILTIRSHYCKINYESKWFIDKSKNEYTFDQFSQDVKKMTSEDIIENMSAELYKTAIFRF